MTSRLSTQPYPDNPRSEWVTRPTAPLRLEGGLYRFAYDVWPTQRSLDAGDPPFVKHGYIAQIRENHQRIRLNVLGELLHVSGIAVPPDDVEEFLRVDPRAYRWATRTLALWVDDRNRVLNPFMFPTYQGVLEALDPQWQRERFTVPLADQMQELIAQQLISDEQHRWMGDRSHTTLDLQVGASADDSRKNPAWSSTSIGDNAGATSAGEEVSSQMRFTSVTIPQGSTIDVAEATLQAVVTNSATACNTNLSFEAADNPAQVTSGADFDGRALTSVVAWDNIPTFTVDLNYTTPSIVTPLQEVINRGGFVSGNASTLFWKNDGSSSGAFRQGKSYDGSSVNAPKLHIEYTAAGGGDVYSGRGVGRGIGRGIMR